MHLKKRGAMEIDRRQKMIEEFDMEFVKLYTVQGTRWQADAVTARPFDHTVGKGLNLLVKKGIDAVNAAETRRVARKYPGVDLTTCKGVIPYNFMTHAPWKGGRECTLDEALEAASRLSGWMVAATRFPVLMSGLLCSMSYDGMGSPKTKVNLWKVYQRRSPGEVARRMVGINTRAKAILGASTEKWPTREIVLKLAIGKLPVRKAAIVAASTCTGELDVIDDLVQRSLDGVLEGGSEVRIARKLLVEFLDVRRMRYLGWRNLGWSPKCPTVRQDTSTHALQVLKGQGGWVRKAAWKHAPDGGHGQVAVIQLAALIGCPKELNGFISKGTSAGISVHDLGINLNKEYPSGVKEWFLRVTGGSLNTATLSDATKVANNWGWLVAEGWKPDEKGSVKKGVELAATVLYSDVRSKAFALECGKNGVSADEYTGYENRWVAAQLAHRELTIPAPGGVQGITVGDLTLRMIDKSDPTALFIGEYTGCCQHPGGAGDSAAWHSVESDGAGVWAVSYKGTIVAQSLVWTAGDRLIIDNIEAMGHETVREQIASIYVAACRAVIGVLGVGSVWLGSHNDVKLPTVKGSKQPNSQRVTFYTDAKMVKMVITD